MHFTGCERLIPKVLRLTQVHLVILVWMITWITAVPLFHVHIPDTTDRWSALRSGGAHTVFTADLPGEFFHPFHDSQPGHSSHLSHRIVHSPELGIAVLDEPEERKAKALYYLEDPSYQLSTPYRSTCMLELPEGYGKYHLLLQALYGSRAPPRTVDL